MKCILNLPEWTSMSPSKLRVLVIKWNVFTHGCVILCNLEKHIYNALKFLKINGHYVLFIQSHHFLHWKAPPNLQVRFSIIEYILIESVLWPIFVDRTMEHWCNIYLHRKHLLLGFTSDYKVTKTLEGNLVMQITWWCNY